MRILLASHSSTLLGGSERSLAEIAAYLVEHGDEVLVAVPEAGPLKSHLESRGVQAEAMSFDWAVASPDDALLLKSLAGLPGLTQRVASWRPDVIMTNTSVVPWFAHVARRLGIPHAWFLREDVTADIGIAYAPSVQETLATIAELSDAILVNSLFLQQRYASLLGSRHLHVVYPTFDRLLAHEPPVETTTHVRGRGTILVYGIILPAKNQMEALEAIQILREGGRDVRLTIMGGIGSRSYFESLTAFVDARGLGRSVMFVPHQDAPYDTVRAHDVVVVPSRAEPFGRVTVEAMALGRPVVASDSGGNSEIIRGGDDVGVLYPPGRPDRLAEALAALLDDLDRRRGLGARARAYAIRRFVLGHSLAECRDILSGVAGAKKQPDPNWIAGPGLGKLAEHSPAGTPPVAPERPPEDRHSTWSRTWLAAWSRLRTRR